jgi:hypothetical protein
MDVDMEMGVPGSSEPNPGMESITVNEGVGGNTDYTMSDPPPGRGLSIIDFAYTNPNDNITNNPHFHSAPTSPRGTRTIDTDTGPPNLNRSSSAEPSTSFLHNLEISPDPEPKPDLEMDMDMGMGMGMEWIDRKPSIYTLINSQPASPFISHPHTQTHLNALNAPGTFSLGLDLDQSGSGSGGTESPTLFGETNVHELADSVPIPNGDQEMGRGRRMSFMRSSLSLGMNMSIPSAGGVGRLSLGGSEGLGLGLGLEHAT